MTDWGQSLIPLLSLFPLWYPHSSQKCHRPGLPLASWFNPFLLLESLPRLALALCSDVGWEGRKGSQLWTMDSQCTVMDVKELLSALVSTASLGTPPSCQNPTRLSDGMWKLLQDANSIDSAWSGADQSMLVVTFNHPNKGFPFDSGIWTQGLLMPGERYATSLQPQLCFEFLFETKSH